jgi:hypothetical protein
LTEGGTKDRVLSAGDKAFAQYGAALAVAPAHSRALIGLARAETLAGTLQIAADPRLGMATVRKGLGALRRLPPAVRDSPETQVQEARMERLIAFSEGNIGDFADALTTLEHPRQVYEQIAALDPRNAPESD